MQSIHFRVCRPGRNGNEPKGAPTRDCSKKVMNCPEVTIAERWVTITDDFGGKIRMSRRQLRLLLSMSQKHLGRR